MEPSSLPGSASSLSGFDEITQWLVAQIAASLHVEPHEVELDAPFARYGIDSVQALAITRELGDRVGRTLSATAMWECPTIAALARYALSGAGSRGDVAPEVRSGEAEGVDRPGRFERPERPEPDEPLAIVGMACRFPRAPDLAGFWRVLAEGIDATGEVPPERWDAGAYYDADRGAPGKAVSRRAALLDHVDRFDPLAFGISPREAQELDPAQRLALELSWEALEHAGIPPMSLQGSATGVFFGSMWHDWADLTSGDLAGMTAHRATGQAPNMIANRVSYALGLRGPSLVVDTACSSSLVALHYAGHSVRSGEATLAIVGGVNLILAPETMVFVSKFGGLAPDGRCKAFSARADGFGRGEGGGVIVLKRLSQAQRDGDRIYATVRATAVNNDGASYGLTAPSPQAQEAVLREAYARAGVAPAAVHLRRGARDQYAAGRSDRDASAGGGAGRRADAGSSTAGGLGQDQHRLRRLPDSSPQEPRPLVVQCTEGTVNTRGAHPITQSCFLGVTVPSQMATSSMQRRVDAEPAAVGPARQLSDLKPGPDPHPRERVRAGGLKHAQDLEAGVARRIITQVVSLDPTPFQVFNPNTQNYK